MKIHKVHIYKKQIEYIETSSAANTRYFFCQANLLSMLLYSASICRTNTRIHINCSIPYWLPAHIVARIYELSHTHTRTIIQTYIAHIQNKEWGRSTCISMRVRIGGKFVAREMCIKKIRWTEIKRTEQQHYRCTVKALDELKINIFIMGIYILSVYVLWVDIV